MSRSSSTGPGGMLTTMTESGKHVSRPMALQDVEFAGDL
jgi:hypothetical protein